jgi:hypothetical protein
VTLPTIDSVYNPYNIDETMLRIEYSAGKSVASDRVVCEEAQCLFVNDPR